MRQLPVAFGGLLAAGVLLQRGWGTLDKGLQAAAAGSASGASPSSGGTPGIGGIVQSLFPNGMHINWSRHDQGRDLEGQAGAPVFAPGNGYLLQNGNNPGGFGISYPVVHFTSGPWAGLDVYFGHIQSALSSGAHFNAGTVLGHLGNGTGPYVGNATGISGHIEIGMWPPGSFGAPLPPGL